MGYGTGLLLATEKQNSIYRPQIELKTPNGTAGGLRCSGGRGTGELEGVAHEKQVGLVRV